MNGPSHVLQKSSPLFTKLSQQCAAVAVNKSLSKAYQLHALVVISGLESTGLHSNLTTVYAARSCISHARRLFDKMPERTLFLYNTMMKMYAHNGSSSEAIKLFVRMGRLEKFQPDNFTYPVVIKACSELGLCKLGTVFHGRTLISGFDKDIFVRNCFIAMYMNFGEVKEAKEVFDSMGKRSVVSWNTLISGYYKNGYAKMALMVLGWLMDDGDVEPDCASVISVLPACGHLKEVEMGRRVHELIENKGLGEKIEVWNALVDMYLKCGSVDEAKMVFDKMSHRDVVTWTSMINGYISYGEVRNALGLLRLMQFEGVRPNSVTIASLLSACCSSYYFKDGRCLHGWTIRQKLDSDVIVETALIDMYAKCNHAELSFLVFERTSRRTVPWNAIISGCIHNKLAREAVEYFKQMLIEEVQPNDATLKSLLPSYAILADLQQAMNIYCYVIKSGFLPSVEVATALIDIFSKCGNLESAYKLFSSIPRKEKDVILWSVIIASYGMHGSGDTAVSLFKEMIQSGVRPNEVTFTSTLHACSHAGLLDEGLELFEFMVKNYQTSLCADHYTCMVDLLGRAGRLDEAYDLIRMMPFKTNHAVWGALLGACVIHENVDLGEIAAKWLFKLEPENTGNYVLMAKIYAAVGRWKDAENVRDMMNGIGLIKTPAHSLVEVRNI